MNKLKVVGILPSLGSGGAEMHFVRIANALDPETFEVTAIVLRRGGSYEAKLLPHVAIRSIKSGISRPRILVAHAVVSRLEQALREIGPHIAWSLFPHLNIALTRAAAVRPFVGYKVVLSQQNRLGLADRRSAGIGHRLLLRSVCNHYSRADQIVAISKGVKGELEGSISNIRQKTAVIYNAGFEANILDLAEEELGEDSSFIRGSLVIACGRLTRQKGFDILIEAFSIVRKRMEATLMIIGAGELSASLQKKIEGLGLQESVKLLGFRSNPFKYFKRASVFVLSSRWEGFGNVVTEAMACGAPVVAADCEFGPGEIIQDGHNGLLVPPEHASETAEAILRLLSDKELARRIAESGRERSRDFDSRHIAKEYASLFRDLVKRSN